MEEGNKIPLYKQFSSNGRILYYLQEDDTATSVRLKYTKAFVISITQM